MNTPPSLWLCVGFPSLLLDARAIDTSEQPARALVARNGSQRWIHSVNREAHSCGVRREQPVATAMALQPELQLQSYSAPQEQQQLEQVALWAYRFSSVLSLVAPSSLLLEIGASLHLFEGLQNLQQQLREGLDSLGYRYRLGVAPTPLAARLNARLGNAPIPDLKTLRQVLPQTPISALLLDKNTHQGLARAGLRSTAQLLQLPRAALARRFGPSCCLYLDRLSGQQHDPQPLFTPPERFKQQLELLHEVENTSALIFPLRRLIETLASHLIARDSGVNRVLIQLDHPRIEASCITIRLLEPSADASRLLRLARQQLDQLQLPEAVRALHLKADELHPIERDNIDLLSATKTGSANRHQDHHGVLEQLTARLGQHAVLQLELRDDHRPECAGASLKLDDERSTESLAPSPHPRPLWLLETPRLAPVKLQLESGPERLESGWWEDIDVRRDYYIARDTAGFRYWVFERREQPGKLYLHGYFG